MSVDQGSMISTEGQEVIGNDANRFDTWRQSGTLGPQPPTAESGPPEQGGPDAPSAD